MKKVFLASILLLLVISCSPIDKAIQGSVKKTLDSLPSKTSAPTSETILSHTPTLKVSITPSVTPSPTITPTTLRKPAGYQAVRIEYEVETYSPRVWIPAPRYWDGQGLLSIKYIEISPEPSNWLREENGTEILYWENNTGVVQIYRLVFDVELANIDISAASIVSFPPYEENSYLYQKYIKTEKNIQSDSNEISELAKGIVGEETNPYHQAKLLHTWMTRNIVYEPGDRDALSVLHKMGSDCAGRAHLYVAFLRSIGIPSRTVAGIHSPGSSILKSGVWYPDKTMGYHVWVEFYLPDYGWSQVDPGNSTFEEINENRIVTSKGTDIQVGHGFPNSTTSWLHLPYNTQQQIEDEPIRFNVSKMP